MKKTVPYLLLVILFAGAAWYSFIRQPDVVHEVLPPHLPPAMPVQAKQPEPQLDAVDEYGESEPDLEPIPEPLPLLNESDAEVTRVLAEIIGSDPLTEYLVKNHVISRVVATIDSLTSRQVPDQINPIRPARNKFVVETEGESIVLSPANFARYDGYIELIQNADSGALVSLYRRYYPLFQQAWEENGGEGPFNERLIYVIDQLLETPDVPGPVYLTKPEAFYLYAEPELEAMTAGQKLLVRMGSFNAAVVKEQLRELRARLGS